MLPKEYIGNANKGSGYELLLSYVSISRLSRCVLEVQIVIHVAQSEIQTFNS